MRVKTMKQSIPLYKNTEASGTIPGHDEYLWPNINHIFVPRFTQSTWVGIPGGQRQTMPLMDVATLAARL